MIKPEAVLTIHWRNQTALQKQEANNPPRPCRHLISKTTIAPRPDSWVLAKQKIIPKFDSWISKIYYNQIMIQWVLHSSFRDFTDIYLNDNILTTSELQKQAEVDILQRHWELFWGTLVTYHRQMTLEFRQIRQKQNRLVLKYTHLHSCSYHVKKKTKSNDNNTINRFGVIKAKIFKLSNFYILLFLF